jgi:hypothetical protein
MWGLTSCNGVQDAPTFGLRMPATARRRGRRMRTVPNSPPLGPRASLRPGSAARPKPAPVVTEYWMGSDETGTRVLGASAFNLGILWQCLWLAARRSANPVALPLLLPS